MLIERGLLAVPRPRLLRDLVAAECAHLRIDAPPVRKHWASALRKSFGKLAQLEVIEMPDGERSKTLAQLEKLAREDGEPRRRPAVRAAGAWAAEWWAMWAAFLASMFMRGIPVIQIPTTLLAQVDSAIGGKTGVNLTDGKNLLGTFHQPLAVLVDPDVLATLPEREYRSGLFEAMKYGVIRNPAIFELMEEIAKRCCGAMRSAGEADHGLHSGEGRRG